MKTHRNPRLLRAPYLFGEVRCPKLQLNVTWLKLKLLHNQQSESDSWMVLVYLCLPRNSQISWPCVSCKTASDDTQRVSVDITEHKHPTVEFTSVDRRCSQADKSKYKYTFLSPKSYEVISSLSSLRIGSESEQNLIWLRVFIPPEVLALHPTLHSRAGVSTGTLSAVTSLLWAKWMNEVSVVGSEENHECFHFN